MKNKYLIISLTCAVLIAIIVSLNILKDREIVLSGAYTHSFERNQHNVYFPEDLALQSLKEVETLKLLNHYDGKTVLINIWASWCAPCIKEIPQLITLAAGSNNIELILLSVDQKREDALEFMNQHDEKITHNITLAWDPDRFISSNYFKTNRYPETIILDGNRKLIGKIIGLVDWEDPDISNFINSLSTTQTGDTPS